MLGLQSLFIGGRGLDSAFLGLCTLATVHVHEAADPFPVTVLSLLKERVPDLPTQKRSCSNLYVSYFLYRQSFPSEWKLQEGI